MFILIVRYNFNCPWDSQKKERISQLLSERVLLITGKNIFEKIRNISFCEREWIEDKLPISECLLSGDRLAALSITRDSYIEAYEIIVEKDMLFSMLATGAGQSHFDDLIIKLKKIIQ